MTIYEKYYAMNTAINSFLKQNSYTAKVYKYGTVAPEKPYPYFQSVLRVTRRQPYGSNISGTLTDFEYDLNFFTAAGHERSNDAALFTPYEAIREAITSPKKPLWSGIANVLCHNETPEFNFKGGLEVIQKGLVFECQAVTSFVTIIDSGKEIPIEEITKTISESLNEV